MAGTVEEAELGNENGYVVWDVEVKAENGTLHEVVVDAGNGQVLAQQADDEGSEQGEAADEDSEANEGLEGSEANEPAEASDK